MGALHDVYYSSVLSGPTALRQQIRHTKDSALHRFGRHVTSFENYVEDWLNRDGESLHRHGSDERSDDDDHDDNFRHATWRLPSRKGGTYVGHTSRKGPGMSYHAWQGPSWSGQTDVRFSSREARYDAGRESRRPQGPYQSAQDDYKIDDGRNQWQTPRRSEETYVRRPRLREKTYFRYVIPHEDRSDRDREGRPGQDRHRPVHDDDGIDYGQTAQHPPGQGGEEHVPYTVSEPGDPDFDTKQHTSRSGQPYETFRTDPENSANRGWLLGTLAQTQRELEAEEYIWNSISGPHGQSRIVPIGSELWKLKNYEQYLYEASRACTKSGEWSRPEAVMMQWGERCTDQVNRANERKREKQRKHGGEKEWAYEDDIRRTYVPTWIDNDSVADTDGVVHDASRPEGWNGVWHWSAKIW